MVLEILICSFACARAKGPGDKDQSAMFLSFNTDEREMIMDVE